jgi:FkbM family methyltransferase
MKSKVAEVAKAIAARSITLALGRRNTVRTARYLLDYGRLDVSSDILSDGELLVQRDVVRHWPNGAPIVVFDVGANVGRWTMEFLRAAAELGRLDVQVHAFEPSRYTFRQLELALEDKVLQGQVHLMQFGLSNTLGEATLYKVHEGAGTNSLHQYDGWTKSIMTETVRLSTVDAYVADHNIRRIALLKCDAEGHDMAVLEGARETLGRYEIDIVQFEYNHRWIVSRQFLRDAFLFFEPLGYILGKVTRFGLEIYPGWDAELETFREGNYIACRPNWADRVPTVQWWNDPATRAQHRPRSQRK